MICSILLLQWGNRFWLHLFLSLFLSFFQSKRKKIIFKMDGWVVRWWELWWLLMALNCCCVWKCEFDPYWVPLRSNKWEMFIEYHNFSYIVVLISKAYDLDSLLVFICSRISVSFSIEIIRSSIDMLVTIIIVT